MQAVDQETLGNGAAQCSVIQRNANVKYQVTSEYTLSS